MPLKSGPDFTRAPAAPGLAWITHLHLLLAAGISVLLLSVLCFIENFHDEAYFRAPRIIPTFHPTTNQLW